MFEDGARLANDGSGRPVYDFSIGNPELEPPPEFKKALREIVDDDTPGQHKYMANIGFEATRAAVASDLSKDHDLPFKPQNIVMTVGAGGAVNVTLKALIDPGEEVIVNAPYFVEYKFYIENHGATMVVAETKSDFNLDIDDIAAKITDRTRAVIITNPNNPTGVLYPQETLNDLGDLLRAKSVGHDRPIFVIDDVSTTATAFEKRMRT